VIGARLYYLLLRNGYYRAHPRELFTLQMQGLTIHGALIAGVLVFAYLCRRRRQPTLAWADIVIAAVPIGQAIGRWGNWANQEAFGTPTTLPWALHIDPARRPAQYAAFETFHPTFLYEGLLNLVVAAILIAMVLRIPTSQRLRDGDALATYCVLYGLVRLVIEHFRTDSLYIGPLPAAYWLSGALIAVGVTWLVGRRIGPLAALGVQSVSESGTS
jgi:phosphatidylglycerol:prolipoprotein diacylglycerol transferase